MVYQSSSVPGGGRGKKAEVEMHSWTDLLAETGALHVLRLLSRSEWLAIPVPSEGCCAEEQTGPSLPG